MKQFSKDLGNVSLAPKGKWSREQEYERLSLVYNACDNLSYVAKIDVPSGVDIENREYWQPMNATGYADNNFINLTAENENGTITAYETLEEAVATILPINRRAGATLSFYNLNSDRLDRQAEFELWQFNSTDLANWENRDYWNNVYYNWNVFVGWYVGVDALKNHVKLPTVGQYAYVGSNLNDAVLYQCRTNGTWTNTGTKVRNYISVVVGGNITIGDNGNWFSDGKDTGIPATSTIDEQLDNIGLQIRQHSTEFDKLQKQDVILKSNIDSNFETINNKVDKIKTDTDSKIDTADANLQKQIIGNDNDIATLNTKHESLSKTVEGIAATGGASTATNVTYNKTNSGLNAENAQDAIDLLNNSENIRYNNETSGLKTGNVQEAIDETNTKLSDVQGQINEKQNILTAGKHIIIKDNAVSVDGTIDDLNRQILGYGIEVPQQVTNGSLKSDGTITTEYGLCHIMLDVSDLVGEKISVNSSIDPFQYAFLKSFTPTAAVFADGCTRVAGKMKKVTIPQDANYLYILCGDTNSPTLPTEIITSIDNTGLLRETDNILKETRKPFFINSKDEKGNWQYEIYIPTSDNENYIRIPFCHVIDTSINADSWRIYTAFLNDGSKDLYRIVNNGEWEMSLQIKGRPNFIGGSQHGNEVVQYMNSFVDGVIARTPYSYKGERNYFNELSFIEKTDLFDPSDNVTKVAEHFKKYTFSKAGINIKQKIGWLGNYELTYSYIAMLPIERKNSEKQITDRWYDNKTYKVYDVSQPNFRGYPIEMKHGCSAQFICGSTSNINASVEVVYQKPFVEKCISFLSDSEYFNKIYFDFCGETWTVNNGDVWETDVNYKLDCSCTISR